MKRRLCLIFCLTLFFVLISCGIPYIYIVDSSDVTVSYDTNATTNTCESTIVINNSDLLPSSSQVPQKTGSPSISLVYTIEPINTASKEYSTLVSNFSSHYSNSKGSPTYIPEYDSAVFTYENNSITYGVFSLFSSDSSKLDVSSLNIDRWSISFSLSDNNTIKAIINSDTANPIIFKRFNGNSFNKVEHPFLGYEVPSGLKDKIDTETYQVRIYAMVSFDFSGDYTNTFNTSIRYNYPIFTFTI